MQINRRRAFALLTLLPLALACGGDARRGEELSARERELDRREKAVDLAEARRPASAADSSVITQAPAPEPEEASADRSERYVGTWTDRATLNYGSPGTLRIVRAESRFLIYPTDFYAWGGDRSMNGKAVPAEYDRENDKLVASYGSVRIDVVLNPVEGTLLVSRCELVRTE